MWITSHVRATLLASATVVALAGCAAPPVETADLDPAFVSAIERAQEQGASQDQLDLLLRVAQAGEVTLDDLHEALAATYACLDDSGIPHQEVVEENSAGIVMVSYLMQKPPTLTIEESTQISDACTLRHSYFVEEVYMTQPSAVDLTERYRAEVVIPALTACFDEYGVAYDAESSATELWDLAFEVELQYPNRKPGDGTVAGCLLSALEATH